MGITNTSTTGKKCKNEPQGGVSPPTQDATEDAEQALPPPKKKMKASDESFQRSATTTATERNQNAPSTTPSKVKKMNNISAKKRPTSYESNDAPARVNLAHPAKKAKVDKQAALPKVPIHRTGEFILNF
jgi:hypothetical protein